MNKIAVLVDFTDGCKIAIEQALVLARTFGASLHAVYFAPETADTPVLENELKEFVQSVTGAGTDTTCVIAKGDLMRQAAFVIGHIDPVLVVVGTHGIRGIVQHLFGAHILKLVQAIPYPCIVVQENTKVKPDGFRHILFPAGPHPRYSIKTEQTSMVAAAFDAEVLQYEIDRNRLDHREKVVKNTHEAKAYFEAKNIRHSSILEDSTVISLGYARQTLQYASEHGTDLISVMADIPADDYYFGKTDKENILTNPHGIPVLCCNR